MNRQSMTVAVALLVTVGLGYFVFAGGKPTDTAVAPGAQAPAFTLPDTAGKNVTLAHYTGKLVVIEWTNPGCPFVQRHAQAKTMETLADKYRDKGVVWLAIDSSKENTAATDADWVKSQNLSYPILGDFDGKIGHAYGARNTPHMFIVDGHGAIVYAGGIDNDPQGNKSDRVNYVDQALTELTAGKPVSVPQTRPYGCGVHYAN